jgi:3-methyladenine DNA glycosylase AlkD
MPATKTTKKKPVAARPAKASKPAKARMTLTETMRELEKAGSAQTRKTYLRHGATEPMFGVSFATLKTLSKRIGVDHELAVALWETGNFDARNLAVKIIDPAVVKSADLDRWVRETSPARMCSGYVAMLAAEGENGKAKAAEWLAAKDDQARASGWIVVAQLAQRDESIPDSWFEKHLATIERTIDSASNRERENMNQVVIAVGGRNAGLRKAALAAAKRIGVVEVDHGDTDCKTPDATEYIEKSWAHAKSKGFDSPAAQERSRELLRLRC